MLNHKLTYEKLELRTLMATIIEFVPIDGFYLEDIVDPPLEPAVLISGPTSGRGNIHPNGVIGYAPNIGFRGVDNISIQLSDDSQLDVTFVVGNRNPLAVDDTYTTIINTPIVEISPGFLSNDSDPDGDTFTTEITTTPSNGVALSYSTGQFIYWPNEDFVGNDTFEYTITDDWGNQDSATVNITIAAASSPGITKTFEIHNTGTGNLELTGIDDLVQINGSDDFAVTKQPQAPIVLPGQSLMFDITFTPSVIGTQVAQVTILNNDNDEGSYSFAISGTGTNSDATPNKLNVVDFNISGGSTSPNAVDISLEELLASNLLTDLLPFDTEQLINSVLNQRIN